MIDKIASAALRAGIGEQLSRTGTPAESFPVIDKIIKGIDFVGRKSINGLMLPGRDPETAALVGLGAGGAYDMYKRFTNSKEENDRESFLGRASRYAVPALGLGLLGKFTNSAFNNYYNEYPLHKA